MTHEIGKMTQNLLRKLKITDFLLDFGFCSKRLFVGIGVLHECTDFIHVCVTQLEAHTVECLKVALSSHLPRPLLKHI